MIKNKISWLSGFLIRVKCENRYFWFYKNQVLGIVHGVDFGQVDSLGLVDSPFTHVDYWPTIQKRIPELAEIEYEHISRGRIVYDKNRDSFLVYLDEKLHFQEQARKICDFLTKNKKMNILMVRCPSFAVKEGYVGYGWPKVDFS